MGRLDGKVALISGGARGQGATEAKLFVREGAKVVLGDVRDEEGGQVEAEIRTAGGEVTYVHLNVTSEADWRAAVETANDVLRATLSTRGDTIVADWFAHGDDSGLVADDGVHLTGDGQYMFAATIASAIVDLYG